MTDDRFVNERPAVICGVLDFACGLLLAFCLLETIDGGVRHAQNRIGKIATVVEFDSLESKNEYTL